MVVCGPKLLVRWAVMEQKLGTVPHCQPGGGGIGFSSWPVLTTPGRYHDRPLIVSGEISHEP